MKKVKDKQQDSEVKQARKENFKGKFILFIKLLKALFVL